MIKFLSAEWRDLIMVNYEVDVEILRPLLPKGTDFDLQDGRCFVSLLGFMFLNTRVLGIPVPFHVNFEEANLRFYVKREMPDETRRGVCFIKEVVPRWAVAFVARTFWGEPYEAVSMRNSRSETNAEYSWTYGDSENRIATSLGANLGVPAEGSHPEFIIEHYWGYTKRSATRTDEYKVSHPKWELREVVTPKIDVDFERVYGPRFAFLSDLEPYSVLFAHGSEVAVYMGKSFVNSGTSDGSQNRDR